MDFRPNLMNVRGFVTLKILKLNKFDEYLIIMVMKVLPRSGALCSGMISMKQVSLNDVRRRIFAANYTEIRNAIKHSQSIQCS